MTAGGEEHDQCQQKIVFSHALNLSNFTIRPRAARDMPSKEKIRLDKYLWSIRLFKTRTEAAEACDKGKVKFNGVAAKASRNVSVGDEYEVKTEAKRWRIKVAALLDHRVKYAQAISYYIDITPAEEIERLQFQSASFNTGKRQSKIGRPTKKDRRELDGFMGE
jgi:ribosome-associated heat shock protein Hsp15